MPPTTANWARLLVAARHSKAGLPDSARPGREPNVWFRVSTLASRPAESHPTQPFAAAPTNDRFGEMVPLVWTATQGAIQPFSGSRQNLDNPPIPVIARRHSERRKGGGNLP
jgi:hypothetical protein